MTCTLRSPTCCVPIPCHSLQLHEIVVALCQLVIFSCPQVFSYYLICSYTLPNSLLVLCTYCFSLSTDWLSPVSGSCTFLAQQTHLSSSGESFFTYCQCSCHFLLSYFCLLTISGFLIYFLLLFGCRLAVTNFSINKLFFLFSR